MDVLISSELKNTWSSLSTFTNLEDPRSLNIERARPTYDGMMLLAESLYYADLEGRFQM